MRFVSGLIAAAAVTAALAFPVQASAQEKASGQKPAPDTVVLQNNRGAITFQHGKHSKATECATCHHASKDAKPLPAGVKEEKCSDCHTSTAVAPMTTTLKAAMHNPAEKTGICFDCHVKQAAAGKTTPSKCSDCHVRPEGTW